mmetsp:Transcript_8934/g.26836  ORF Transcript_8934/g.26836 Transcript_8934/m.26836 type:complete len:491 (+) Transcript_8934:155-1627(+)|eukprot:CAMPEP_0198730018 /NCGR_PEP_ID=MMETSP1475-20131203/22377_1 /TAXON_ID= ORGANISM="Unidentified sp., Strain CCMP1999" /NCGR_SAMPLE_ID=MMETSP1475 /ASSEMBLY_ACC=CAM_ASM_001111 /LENGTH=490 /DNA_ID=CAMNT_0044492761 /DNA_START=111 /DNA_END=1583 /DNA_ORIENTATION=-
MSALQFLNNKSWSVARLHNKERVWLAEQKEAEEKKKMEELRKKLADERQLEELRRLEVESGRLDPEALKKRERVDWMYEFSKNGPESEKTKEQYLLGEKEAKLKTEEEEEKETQRGGGLLLGSTGIRDTEAKLREDPLMDIRLEEQHAVRNILDNPVRMERLRREREERQEALRKEKKHKKEKKAKKHKKEKKEKKEKHKHRSEGEERLRRDSPRERRMRYDSESEDEGRRRRHKRDLSDDETDFRRNRSHHSSHYNDNHHERRFHPRHDDDDRGRRHDAHRTLEAGRVRDSYDGRRGERSWRESDRRSEDRNHYNGRRGREEYRSEFEDSRHVKRDRYTQSPEDRRRSGKEKERSRSPESDLGAEQKNRAKTSTVEAFKKFSKSIEASANGTDAGKRGRDVDRYSRNRLLEEMQADAQENARERKRRMDEHRAERDREENELRRRKVAGDEDVGGNFIGKVAKDAYNKMAFEKSARHSRDTDNRRDYRR